MATSNRQSRRRQQRQTARRTQRRSNSNTILLIAGSVLVIAVLAAVLIGSTLASKHSTSASSPSSSNGAAPVIDGIRCDPQEQVTYHKHTKLNIYVNGVLYAVPPFAGISDQYGCNYYLHIHTGYDEGIIHMEYPYTPHPTLKQFLDVWHATRPDEASPVGAMLKGGPNLHIFVNGKPFNGTVATLYLHPHDVITVDIGKPIKIAPSYTWPKGI